MSGWMIVAIIFVVLRALGQDAVKKQKAAQKAAREAALEEPVAPPPVVEDDRFPTLTPTPSAQRAETARHTPVAPSRPAPRTAQSVRPARVTQTVQPAQVAQVAPAAQPSVGSLLYNSLEGGGPTGSLQGAPDVYAPLRDAAPSPGHVVKPLTESDHAHTESSISGVADCAPDDVLTADLAYELPPDAARSALLPAFDRDALVRGVLYSEILAKPLALRTHAGGRCRK